MMGTTKWSYAWTPTTSDAAYAVLSRAVDDSLNIENEHGIPRMVVSNVPMLDNFGWAQGWGDAVFLRQAVDINHDGNDDYLGFGENSVFVAYGGTWTDWQIN